MHFEKKRANWLNLAPQKKKKKKKENQIGSPFQLKFWRWEFLRNWYMGGFLLYNLL